MKNYTPVYVYPLTEDDGWKSLTGELPVKMTNDYLFRALLQSDNDTLKALLASLLRIDVSDIRSAEVTNPILLGESIEDKRYHLDEWCRLFKAKTWEDMRMLAENNAVMGRAISGVWQLTEEERIREKCRAREQWLINDKWKTDRLAEQEDTIAQQEVTIRKYEISDKKKSDTIARQSDTISQQSDKIAKQSDRLAQQESALKQKDKEIEELKKKLGL